MKRPHGPAESRAKDFFNTKVLHEVFLNPGLYLLFGGILLGLHRAARGEGHGSRRQLLRRLFQGVLCLFLLEMGMTASASSRT